MKNLDSVNQITKLSDLIYLALGDFLKVIADPRFEVHMGYYLERTPTGNCQACFAGAVLAKTCKWEDDGQEPIPDWAIVLDRARLGLIKDALDELNIYVNYDAYDVPHFKNSPEDFINTMYQIAFELKEQGL